MIAVGCSCLTFNAAISASSASTFMPVDLPVILIPTIYHGVMALLLGGVEVRRSNARGFNDTPTHRPFEGSTDYLNALLITQHCRNERGRPAGVSIKLLLKTLALRRPCLSGRPK